MAAPEPGAGEAAGAGAGAGATGATQEVRQVRGAAPQTPLDTHGPQQDVRPATQKSCTRGEINTSVLFLFIKARLLSE